MTVTLDIPPALEPLLQERAARRGQSVADYLLTLAEWADYADFALSEETIAIIEEGVADFRAGDRGISMDEFQAEIMVTLAHLTSQKSKVTA